MNRKLFLLFVLTVLFSSGVFALGITPGRSTFDYSSGKVETVTFTVVNSEHVDMEVVVLVQGELNASIAVSEVSFSMSADEDSRDLQYILTMPPDLTPGLHETEVVVMQLPSKSATSEAFVGASVGVATQVHINVPFPGKYAESSMNVIGPEDDGKLFFVIPVVSRGDLDLVRVRAIVDIFSSLNEKIKTLDTDETSVKSGESGELVATWDTTGAQPGPYRAVATVIYDEQTIKLEKEFTVGKRVLEVQNIEVNDFSLGQIAKFEVLVENKWSQAIVGAFAEMNIFNKEGEVMADFKSATYDIPPLEKKLMVAFWDTAGVQKGTYHSSLFLRYGQSSEQQDLELEVKDNEINIIGAGYVISEERGISGESNSLMIILIVVIVVLVLINVLWFLVLRKKLSGKNDKSK